MPGATAWWRCRGPGTRGFRPGGVCASRPGRSPGAHTAPDDRDRSREGLDRSAYSMRSSAPRGSDSARWMPSASSPVRVAARPHACSVTASGTRMFGSSSLVRPKSRRIGAASALRLSTHAMRCGRTHPCTDEAVTARLCPTASVYPAASGRPLEYSHQPQQPPIPHTPPRRTTPGRRFRHVRKNTRPPRRSATSG